MTTENPIPIVAIVGRPNVGKSTLFNRYAGHRRALVADSPGLTRDRIAEELEIEGRAILLVDTAGLDATPERGLEAAVQSQAESALRDADAILFVVDGQAGLLPEDQAIARTLRRTRKPLALIVNKIDDPRHHSDRLMDFYGLGFERMSGVSAEHGGGAFDALEDLVGALPECPASQSPPEGAPPRIALVGRPNVGKSSLMNRLLGEDRVVVSAEAGTTRDAIDIPFLFGEEPFVLIDTAGMKRPGRRSGTGEKIGALMAVRALERAQVALLVVDASERRIPTAELNRWLVDTVRRHDPGMARKGPRSHPLKFLYASQVGVSPPRFVLFCTDPDSVLPSYQRFLENRLRESFGFEGSALRLHLRARSKRGAPPG